MKFLLPNRKFCLTKLKRFPVFSVNKAKLYLLEKPFAWFLKDLSIKKRSFFIA